jgi:chromosome segregation ATPase
MANTASDKNGAAEPTPESLDAVRDILFGGQMRTVETRLRNIEDRFQQELESLRAEFQKRAGELDQFARKETQALHERVAAENDSRVQSLRELANEVKETFKETNKRHVALEQSTSLSDAELRDQLIAHAKASANELNRIHEKLSAELAKSHADLTHAKTDRSQIAALLGEVAQQIAANPGTPKPTKG